MEDTEAQLQLKKRARRRLVGAVAFAVLVAVVLPMLMDREPKPTAQNVEIRIPGQDEKPFTPNLSAPPADRQEAKPADKPELKPAEAKPPVEPAVPTPAKPEVKPTARVVDSEAAKPVKPEKPAAKPEKPAEKPLADHGAAEAKRAAAILAGKFEAPAASTGGEQVILIGAFTNDANVKNLKNKLNELGIKVFTEPLASPQGPKTRVRAGPFPNREAAEKALERMKRIGVSGVIAAKP